MIVCCMCYCVCVWCVSRFSVLFVLCNMYSNMNIMASKILKNPPLKPPNLFHTHHMINLSYINQSTRLTY